MITVQQVREKLEEARNAGVLTEEAEKKVNDAISHFEQHHHRLVGAGFDWSVVLQLAITLLQQLLNNKPKTETA